MASTLLFPLHISYLLLLLIVISINVVQFLLTDSSDRYRCHALLNSGTWLDDDHQTWQPDGCILHQFKPQDVATCATNRRFVFIGDSTVRLSFYAAAQIVDAQIETVADKHSDRSFTLHDGIQFDFYWDPFLNRTETLSLLSPDLNQQTDPAALLVFGSGLWYLRHYNPEIAMSLWSGAMDNVFDAIDTHSRSISDQIIILPVEQVVEDKLTGERKQTLHSPNIDAMNADLLDRLDKRNHQLRYLSPPNDGDNNDNSNDYSDVETIATSGGNFYTRNSLESLPDILSMPVVFNDIVRTSSKETSDGMHFSETISRLQANILYNLRCSDFLEKTFPMDKTCCSRYPPRNNIQSVLLAIFLLIIPFLFHFTNLGLSSTVSRVLPRRETLVSLSILGLVMSLCFFADRTSTFLKEQKLYDPIHFTVLTIVALVAGIFTMTKPQKDLGFLNRDQTDEWKGWMQIAILIYHYLGASKISGIYNPIRVLVAAYLFQSGYGHFFYYYKKADFGFSRVFSVLIRLNLLTVFLVYTMGTDYLSYYFSPLVTMWFGIIWLTMFVGHSWNHNFFFIVSKIFVFACITSLFFNLEWPLEFIFSIINQTLNTNWIAKEWSFRVTLDLYVVFGGMLTALASIKLKEFQWTSSPNWQKFQSMGIIASASVMVLYFVFELGYNKFDYNKFHPFISFWPVLAYCILRNASPLLRSTSSKVFIFFGKCSLETFLLQYHLFIAPDTKGIIMMIPGTKWRPINFIVTSVIFVYASHLTALATNELTSALSKTNPTPTRTTSPPSSSNTTTHPMANLTSGETSKEALLSQNVSDPTSTLPILNQERPSLVSRLWNDLRFRFGAIVVCLFILNWIYPTEPSVDGHILPTH